MRITILGVLSMLVVFNVAIGLLWTPIWWFLLLSVTLLIFGLYDAFQSKHAILKFSYGFNNS